MATDLIITEPPPFTLRLPTPFLIGLATVVLVVAAVAGEPADGESDENASLLEPQQPVELNFEMAKARHSYATAIKLLDAVATREQGDASLRQKVAVIDQVCRLTGAQRQKLELAVRGDITRRIDRAEEIEAQYQFVKDDVHKINELREKALLLRRGYLWLSNDDSLSVKLLEKLLTTEQTARYQPLRLVFRTGGRARIYESGSDEVLAIRLNETDFADGGLARLCNLPNLHHLSLAGTWVTDVGLAHLPGMTRLEYLDLNDTKVTDAGLTHLEGLTKLEILSLDNTKVTDAGLAHLKGLTGLRNLNLVNIQVTDAGLVQLRGLTNLERLVLDGTKVSGEGLSHLTGLTKLTRLWLMSTQVTDAGLPYLEKLTSLQEIQLTRTHVTEAGIDRLKHALPGMKFVYR